MKKVEVKPSVMSSRDWLVEVANYTRHVWTERIETQVGLTPREFCLSGLFLRVGWWMGSMKKLASPFDVQALSCCARSLVETTVDMLLIHMDKQADSAERMKCWEESARLKAAEGVLNHFGSTSNLPEYVKPQSDFVNAKQSTIRNKRIEYWNGKHPPRWTGNRNLRKDIQAVDSHFDWLKRDLGVSLTEYHDTNYQFLHWYVHGSGLMGIANVSVEGHLLWGNQCYEVSARLALICAKVIQIDYGFFASSPAAETTWAALMQRSHPMREPE